jgi:hypothetical protein
MITSPTAVVSAEICSQLLVNAEAAAPRHPASPTIWLTFPVQRGDHIFDPGNVAV